MKKCPNCGKDIADSATICSYCGKDFSVPVLQSQPETGTTTMNEKEQSERTGIFDLLKLIYTQQEKQTKHLRNINQIVFLIGIIVILLVVLRACGIA